jgi:hypothetical protein
VLRLLVLLLLGLVLKLVRLVLSQESNSAPVECELQDSARVSSCRREGRRLTTISMPTAAVGAGVIVAGAGAMAAGAEKEAAAALRRGRWCTGLLTGESSP